MRIPFDINGAFVVQSSRSQIGTKNDRKHISPHSWQAIASAQDVCLIFTEYFCLCRIHHEQRPSNKIEGLFTWRYHIIQMDTQSRCPRHACGT